MAVCKLVYNGDMDCFGNETMDKNVIMGEPDKGNKFF